MTRFKIKLVKKGIFYFFISNLSLEEKKHWVRKEYNEIFLQKTGGILSDREKKSLDQLSAIINSLERQPNPVNLLDIFFGSNHNQKLKKALSPDDYLALIGIFNVFANRFNILWEKEIKKITSKTGKSLKNNITNERSFVKKNLKRLSIFYRQPYLPRKINIFLVPLPEGVMSGGGKYIKKLNGILIESSAERAARRRTIEIILHETVHLWFENNYFNNLITKIEKTISQEQKKDLINKISVPSVRFGLKEVTATILTIFSSESHNQSPFMKFIGHLMVSLRPIISSYEKEKRPIDEALILKIIEKWSEFDPMHQDV